MPPSLPQAKLDATFASFLPHVVSTGNAPGLHLPISVPPSGKVNAGVRGGLVQGAGEGILTAESWGGGPGDASALGGEGPSNTVPGRYQGRCEAPDPAPSRSLRAAFRCPWAHLSPRVVGGQESEEGLGLQVSGWRTSEGFNSQASWHH